MGGSNVGHFIDNVHAYGMLNIFTKRETFSLTALASLAEPRGWSAVHLIEGTDNSCLGATFTNNQIGN